MLIDIAGRTLEENQVIVSIDPTDGKLILGVIKELYPDTGSIVVITVDTARVPIETITTISFPSTMIAVINTDCFSRESNKDHCHIINWVLPHNQIS